MAAKKNPEKDYESWFQGTWRPSIAWQYFVVCLFDFLVAPILTAAHAKWAGIPYVPWEPLTNSAGGIYHISMGAIIGVTAWSRSNEKIKMMEYGSYPRRRSFYGDPRGKDRYEDEESPRQEGSQLTGDEGDFETGTKRKGSTND